MRPVTSPPTETGLKPLLVRLGLCALARPWLGGRGAVLVFHRVREPDATMVHGINRQNCVPAASLRALLAALAADGIEIVTLDEAAARLAGPQTPRRFVCLTFDDGYRDNLDALLPILETFRVPATIYVAPGLVDGTAPLWWYGLDHAVTHATTLRLPAGAGGDIPMRTPEEKRAAFATAARLMLHSAPDIAAAIVDALADRHGVDFAALARAHMLDWAGVRTLAASPYVEIGAHTISHPSLARLDEAAARTEMAESRDRLARETGREIRHFAYPYGSGDTVGARELRLAAELGFASAVATTPGNLFRHHAEAPHCWPRHGIGPDDGPAALHLKLAGIVRPNRRGRIAA
jgi:peptidoglycan/xylan/chitin deacetylase (PgdA/CDA1 family)